MQRSIRPAIAGIVVVGLVALVIATGLHDTLASPPGPAAAVGDCPGAPGSGSSGGAGVAAATPGGTSGGGSGSAWWRATSILDEDGTVTGRSLAVGRGEAELARVTLPAESSATGPVGGIVTVAADDGTASTLRLLSVDRRCAWAVAPPAGVLRRAILAADGRTLIAHVVDRDSRADLGVWRGSVGGGAWVRVLEPLDGDAAGIGRVWTTELRTTSDGRLVVQSCGGVACLIRTVPLSGGTTVVTAAPGQGRLVGVAGDRLVVWQECGGAPCPLLLWPVGAAAGTPLVSDAVAAALTADAVLVYLRIDGAGGHLVALDLASGTRAEQHVPAGLLPLSVGADAFAGVELTSNAVGLGSADALPRPFIPVPAGTEVLP